MSESIRIADHLWNDAESLVDRIEHSSQVEACEQSVYDAVTSELLPVATAVVAELWVIQQGVTTTLSRSGVSVTRRQDETDRSATDIPPSSEAISYGPPSAKWRDGLQLVASEQISPQTTIGLTLQFDRAVDGTLSRPLCEVSESLLSLASRVYLRYRFCELNDAIDVQTHRDQVLNQLNAGDNLHESLAVIAGTVATETTADRVTLLRIQGKRAFTISSSTQPRVERRARQVRLLESLVAMAVRHQLPFHFAVGTADSEDSKAAGDSSALTKYLAESGTREIRIESIREQNNEPNRSHVVGAIVLERFRLDNTSKESGFAKFEHLRDATVTALQRAFRRDLVGWPTILARLTGSHPTKRFAWLAGAALVLIAALFLIPSELKIPVDGRLIATQHQRLYAPASGVIANLQVKNREAVVAGAPLIQIRSASLDQQQRQLEGSLATTKSRLAAVTASKSRSSNTTTDRNVNANPLASSNEKVLKTELAGLEAQLELVAQQQRELTLRSPIDGTVDRWDLRQSLAGRPVVHGQHLLDIVSTAQGWTVELEIPDAESQFVVDAQASDPCLVVFRLRSNPDTAYNGKLEHLSGVSQIDTTGRAVMRGTLKVEHRADLRNGATVVAYIHCGRRPLGFIWFRSVIGWIRQVGWF